MRLIARAAKPGVPSLDGGQRRFDERAELIERLRACIAANGQYRNPGGDVAGFTTSYFHRPEDLAAEVADAGLELDRIVGGTGIVKLALPDLAERLDDGERRDAVTSLLRLTESEPSLLGFSQNLVAIARADG